MIRTGNYFWPTINGHLYYDKPLGSYWLVLAATWITGGLSETAARIPCAIAGLLAVGLLILLARRLYDLRIGVIAGFILATSFSFVFSRVTPPPTSKPSPASSPRCCSS